MAAGVSWEIAEARMKGEYYQGQIDYAVREYDRINPQKLVVNVPGYDKYLAAIGL